jgi:WD40 repeat protein
LADLSGAESGDVLCAAFSPDDSLILTGHANGELRLWDASNWTLIGVAKGHINGARVLAVDFDDSGEYAVSGGAGSVPGIDAHLRGVSPADYFVRVWRIRRN